MSNTILNADLTRTLPPPLRDDETILALGQVIAAELQETARLIRKNIIYADFEDLPESIVDILAYDFSVDWYDYSYPIEAKRQLVKDSIRAHKRLGTVYGVKTAIGSIYPNSEIEEWFNYGGDPYHFRIVLNTTQSKAPASFTQIVRTLQFYKRLSANLDLITYECQTELVIKADFQAFKIRYGKAGAHNAGERPKANIIGVIGAANVRASPSGAGYPYNVDMTGTQPQENITFAESLLTLYESDSGEVFKFGYGIASIDRLSGENPQDNITAALSAAALNAAPSGAGYPYDVACTGTNPQDNITFTQTSDNGGISVDTVAYPIEYTPSGTKTSGE
ncbi:hypothetical protein FACS18949_02870 [Clostridia bacterium]|nr:hypothetical protein FACS18949_02870 [Clostridia bacterium]